MISKGGFIQQRPKPISKVSRMDQHNRLADSPQFVLKFNAPDGCPINYEVEGPANAPALLLCNSLGTDLHMWDDQAPIWSKQLRLIRYDRRGHGKSGAPKGPYTMDMLGQIGRASCRERVYVLV